MAVLVTHRLACVSATSARWPRLMILRGRTRREGAQAHQAPQGLHAVHAQASRPIIL